MTHRTVSFFAGCFLLVSACGHRQQPASTPDNTPNADTTREKFFPVADYLRSEIRYVDSTPLAIMKYETLHDKTDSAFLKPEEFKQLASTFLLPELNADSLEKNYTENSFGDKTTGYLNITYSPKDKEQALQRVDVTISPANGVDRVKSIYMEKITRVSDTLMIKKMYWEARHNFLIINSLQQDGKAPEVRQLKVIWDHEE